MSKVAIFVQGGVVQDVLSDDSTITVTIVDFDDIETGDTDGPYEAYIELVKDIEARVMESLKETKAHDQ